MTKIQAGFLNDDGARGIITALQAAGEECRFVGGCVRDALAGLAVKDIDLATTALPEKVMNVLSMVGFQVIPVGIEHGVVLALRDGRQYEVATLREDVQTDGRHAIVAFTQDWELDAQRRDFTMNALSAGAAGTVFDYTDGIADMNARRVRFIGDAAARIQEDYLRILRFYRFHARFSEGDDENARSACREYRSGIKKLSRERITEELEKLLALPGPLTACRMMMADQVAGEISPQLSDIDNLEKLSRREHEFGQLPWYVRLAAWGGLAQQFDETFLDQFIFTRTARAEIKLIATIDLSDLQSALHHHGADRVRMAVLLRASDDELENAIAQINQYVPKEFPFAAEHLLAIGVMPGPRLGEILRETESWWLKGGCTADAQQCKNYAETLAKVSIT